MQYVKLSYRGGGTCPSSHGFDSFASDIGSIPSADYTDIANAVYTTSISDSILTTSADIVYSLYNMLNWSYCYVRALDDKGDIATGYNLPTTGSAYYYIPIVFYPFSSIFTATSISSLNPQTSNYRLAKLGLLKMLNLYVKRFFLYYTQSSVTTTLSIDYQWVGIEEDYRTTSPNNVVELTSLSTASTSSSATSGMLVFQAYDCSAIDWTNVDDLHNDYNLAICVKINSYSHSTGLNHGISFYNSSSSASGHINKNCGFAIAT